MKCHTLIVLFCPTLQSFEQVNLLATLVYEGDDVRNRSKENNSSSVVNIMKSIITKENKTPLYIYLFIFVMIRRAKSQNKHAWQTNCRTDAI